jgi:hypothetical protein
VVLQVMSAPAFSVIEHQCAVLYHSARLEHSAEIMQPYTVLVYRSCCRLRI